MKKLLTVLLTLLMVFTLVGCNSKEETPIVEEPIKQEEVKEEVMEEEPEIVGGYVEVEDKTITPELNGVFATAMQGLLGASYEAKELVATQVVAGTNYKFLAEGTKTTNPITKGTYYIYINEDLQGNISLLDIEVIEEKQEEVKTQDVTQMSFWVVVYDQFSNEISRTTAKYGTIVKDPSGNDVFVNTNKYFHTVVDYPSSKDDEPVPVPDPEYVQVEYLTSQPGAYINSKVKASSDMEFIFDAKMRANVEWCRCFGYWNSNNNSLAFQSSNPNNPGVLGDLMYYIGEGTNTYRYAESGVNISKKTTYDVKYGGTTENASFIKVNGNQVAEFTTLSVDTTKDIAIFSLTSDNMGSGEDKQPLSIYYMKIYKGGLLVRDYIPVKTLKEIDKAKNAANSNTNIPINTLCMYDKVEDMYYPSFGTESFTENDPACLAKGTLISMADGSQKPIEDLKHGDDIKVFNHETGTISHSKILDYWHYEQPQSGLITLHFTNNINVNIVKEHSFYCKEENTYVVLNSSNINDYIGKKFYNAESRCWEMLLNATYSNEKVDTYYLATEEHYNCVAEGMLTVEDGVYYVVCSTFDYDNNMKMDNQMKNADIMQYGLFSHNDFKYLTKDEFDSHKLAYLKVALGKGIITNADLKLLEDVWTSEKEILEKLNVDK